MLVPAALEPLPQQGYALCPEDINLRWRKQCLKAKPQRGSSIKVVCRIKL